jgi:hypothetical protein
MKSIDRFEGDFAIIDDDGRFYSIRRDELPENAAEGDIIETDETGRIKIQKEATEAWRLSLRQRLKMLCENSNKDD